ncbi:hypothetical protein [Paenibacillus medicaginis]|uniref:Uncharacterized protein n=1 Tax=Paenibacillus medicaginis TaxID=1470560 RepID=A0ABV5BUJ4_9BACL
MINVDFLYRLGGLSAAGWKRAHYPEWPVLEMKIETDSAIIRQELNVDKARDLANELLQFVNDVEDFAIALKDA